MILIFQIRDHLIYVGQFALHFRPHRLKVGQDGSLGFIDGSDQFLLVGLVTVLEFLHSLFEFRANFGYAVLVLTDVFAKIIGGLVQGLDHLLDFQICPLQLRK